MGECDPEVIGTSSIFKLVRSDPDLTRMLVTLDLICEKESGICKSEHTSERGKIFNFLLFSTSTFTRHIWKTCTM
jgi:hypothetical protein